MFKTQGGDMRIMRQVAGRFGITNGYGHISSVGRSIAKH